MATTLHAAAVIQRTVAALNALPWTYPTPAPTYDAMPGPRYTRIVRRDHGATPGTGSAALFIDNTSGAFLKAAGWKGPAKGVRYLPAHGDDAAALVAAHADHFGGWLYR